MNFTMTTMLIIQNNKNEFKLRNYGRKSWASIKLI